jgi:DNA polymerase-1
MKTLPPGKPALWLVDGSSYLYRAFFAVQRLSTKAGEPTNAIFGFAAMLRRLRKEQQPEMLAVCFDRRGKTERHEAFEAYKANRKPMPDELALQVEPIKELVAAHRIPCLEMEGQEADDIMGTLARKGREAGLRVVLVTADKDMLQLVDEGDVLEWHTGKEELWGREDVLREWGVPPERMIDVLAIMGDASDNVPGVKGIGEKGAVELVSKLGSLEEIYSRLDEVTKPALRKKLEEGRESAFLSKKLVTIRTDLPFEIDRATFGTHPPDRGALLALFRRWELRRLAEELENEPGDATDARSAGAPDASAPLALRWAASTGEIEAVLASCQAAGRPLVLHATGGGEGALVEPAAGALSAAPGSALAISLRGETGREVAGTIAAALRTGPIRWISDDSKRVLHVFARLGAQLPDPAGDLSLASYVLNPGGRAHAFADVLLDRSGARATTEKEALGREGWNGFVAGALGDGPLRLVGEPAARTEELLEGLETELAKEGLAKVCREIELPLVPVLVRAERNGIRLDRPFLADLSARLEKELARLRAEIEELAGESFNPASPQQLGRILFEKLGYTPTKKTAKTKVASTNVEVLEALAAEGKPIATKLLEHREMSKLKGTYVDALPVLATSDGILHTSFRQTIAATGRLSSSDPNLQNIPVRTELGREIRRAFIARPGTLLVAADYSQIELRLLAHMSGDQELAAAFRRGDDIHEATAALVFGVAPGLVTPEMRRSAKTINFGILYGMGAWSLAADLGISTKEARDFIGAYFSRFPTVRSFLDRTLEEARREGVVRTLFGRVRRLPELRAADRNARANAERMAINAPLQGSAADLMKIAMIRVDSALAAEAPKARILLTVHDELLVEAPEGESATVAALVKREMENAARLDVPLVVDTGSGRSWLEAK